MNIGLIGFGEVGKSFIKLLEMKKNMISNMKLKYIIKSNGGIYNANGINIKEIIYYLDNNISIEFHPSWSNIDINNIIKNKDINYLIELTSTNIEDGEPGYTHIKKALNNNISVITGNKGPILLYYNELSNIAKNNNLNLEVGCTTGGALPSICLGKVGITGADILSIEGILNGTTNYIIEEMSNSKITYEKALLKAQELKIAEANPVLDVSGYDTAIKMVILGKVIMNLKINLKKSSINGIENISLKDIEEANKRNCKIKLIGEISYKDGTPELIVKPKMINKNHPLYFVDGKNKGVNYKTDILGDITVSGGASSPTNAAAAVFRDLLNVIY